MSPIHVVLLELPQMLRDIVTGAIASRPDMDVVVTVATRDALAGGCAADGGAGAARPVDVVLLGVDGAVRLDRDAQVLYDCPRARLVAVSVRDAETVLLELRPHARVLGNVALDDLLDAIRRGRPDGPVVVDAGVGGA